MNDNTGDAIILPSELPLLALRDVVVFPYMIIPLIVGREMSNAAIDAALASDRLITVVTQRDVDVDEPTAQDLYTVGTACTIMRMIKLNEDRVKVLVQGISKVKILKHTKTRPYFQAKVEVLPEYQVDPDDIERQARIRTVLEGLQKVASMGKSIPMEVVELAESITDPGRLADIAASNLNIKINESQEILETSDPDERLQLVRQHLTRELALLDAQARIEDMAREGIHKSQREFFLREQLKAIRKELGEMDERDEEIEMLRDKIRNLKLPKPVNEEAEKQLKRLSRMHGDSAEAGVVRTYLDWIVEIPWSKKSRDKLDLKRARGVLDVDHYGLDKIKDRILEFLAVAKLRGSVRGSILCFVGPPGVGKTSLGRSIARAMGRKFTRISLGGVRDEAEIRGHRRTYVGAMPGKIITGLKQAGTKNPVFMLDEIDKLGADFRGDPSSALLEVLDPEQNSDFVDHYLGVPYDLSQVLFITTANTQEPIPNALHDRMEILRLPGYTPLEKAAIAERYLTPRQMEEAGLKKKNIKFAPEAIRDVIDYYTREAGVRTLERTIGSVCRKVARRIGEGEARIVNVTPKSLEKMLGPHEYIHEEDEETGRRVGLATGLAWTPTGGEILHIEVMPVPGKGALTLTGHLGEVMKESAQAAVTSARRRVDLIGINKDFFAKNDIHMHVPAGAIPKDGPSAGVAMVTALASALSGIPSKAGLAMTGEITLRGRVMPIGGLREKLLAAHRTGIRDVIVPEGNEKDTRDLPQEVKHSIKLHFVHDIDEVLALALERPFKRKKTSKKTSVKAKPKAKAMPKAKAKPAASKKSAAKKKAKKKKSA
jgi:ATP-dependent Lon protease